MQIRFFVWQRCWWLYSRFSIRFMWHHSLFNCSCIQILFILATFRHFEMHKFYLFFLWLYWFSCNVLTNNKNQLSENDDMLDSVFADSMRLAVRTVEIRMFEKASNVTVHMDEVAPINIVCRVRHATIFNVWLCWYFIRKSKV